MLGYDTRFLGIVSRRARTKAEPCHWRTGNHETARNHRTSQTSGGRARCSVGKRAGMCHKTKKMSVYDRPIKHLEGSIV
jgi:hypothetical protein